MSRKETNNNKRTREGKESKDRMFSEFENGIRQLIDNHQIYKKNLLKKAEDDLEKLIDNMVAKYYE